MDGGIVWGIQTLPLQARFIISEIFHAHLTTPIEVEGLDRRQDADGLPDRPADSSISTGLVPGGRSPEGPWISFALGLVSGRNRPCGAILQILLLSINLANS